MAKVQGDLELLQSPTAQALLSSTNVAHLSYIWTDGTPRVVPVWFFWNGEEIILGGPALAPKVQWEQRDASSPTTVKGIDGTKPGIVCSRRTALSPNPTSQASSPVPRQSLRTARVTPLKPGSVAATSMAESSSTVTA